MLYFLREFCETSSVLKVIMFAMELLKIIFILVPIGLIIMISVDFAKNVIAGKEDDMKKNLNVAIKRVIMAVIIFFIPTIVSFVNSIVGESIGQNLDYNECIENANTNFIRDAELEEETEKIEEELNRKDNLIQDITTNNSYIVTIGSGLNGSSLPQSDEYYPLDGKNNNGNDLPYLEIDGTYLTESEMEELDKYIWDSVNTSDDWGTRVATAAYALTYGLHQKGVKMHYMKGGWASATDTSTNEAIGATETCSGTGFCKNWGRLLSTAGIDRSCKPKWGGYSNFQGDCKGTKKYNNKYAGVDCTGLVKWAIRTGCGTTQISDELYQKTFPKGQKGDISVAKTGDVLLTDGHVILFIKKNSDGTYMTVESTSGGANGVFFHKYTEKQLKNYKVVKMHEKWDKYCKKTS